MTSSLSDAFNMTLEEYLLKTRGPKHLPPHIVIPITVVYLLIFTTGIIGNLLVCLVIIKNATMHTATNYYLFSLAVSDLTLLIFGLPNDLNVYWQQYPWGLGEALCKIRAVVSEMTSYTSVLTIVAFSMERYIAISQPLHSYTLSGLRRPVRVISGLWIVSFFCALPFAVFTKVNYVEFPPNSGMRVDESAFCAMLEHNIPSVWRIYEMSSFLFFILPLCTIISIYAAIGMKINQWSENSLGNEIDGTVHREAKHAQSRKAIIRMLLAVVIAFFLCWMPFHLQRLIYLYAKHSPHFLVINEWMYYITGCFYYFSSTINPILYSSMSVKYRTAFKQTLFGKKTRSHRQLNSNCRETGIRTSGESPKWQKNSIGNLKSRNQCIPSSNETVVMVSPNEDLKNKNFTDGTENWPDKVVCVKAHPSAGEIINSNASEKIEFVTVEIEPRETLVLNRGSTNGFNKQTETGI